MVGQHIFMRCWNQMGIAGTWTAAVTPHVLDSDMIRNEVLPRCNLDEKFAQKTMADHPSNHVLRIYHLQLEGNRDARVVSRTYWENDKVTERGSGRKGAYTFSYILTNEGTRDADHSLDDYAGFFDDACFETYDSVVDRMVRTNSRLVTLDEQNYQIFRHTSSDFDARRTFDALGFTEKSFLMLMEGLYKALSDGSKLVICMPRAFREKWEQQGDDSAEQLMRAIMELMPPRARMLLGMVSHWNGMLQDKMLQGIHLVFLHPERREALADLKKSGIGLLDMEAGVYDLPAEAQARTYFRFLWEHMSEPERIRAIWDFGMDNCGAIFDYLPGNAMALECVYSIYRGMQEGSFDTDLSYKIYTSASKIFGGTGKKFPVVEKAVTRALHTLESSPLREDPGFLEAVSRFIMQDKVPTDHQSGEYQIILGRIKAGTAREQEIAALCKDASKQKREADQYLGDMLSEWRSQGLLPNPEMLTVVLGLFHQLQQKRRDEKGYDLLLQSIDLLDSWIGPLDSFHRDDDLKLILDHAFAYMKDNAASKAITAWCCRICFRFTVHSNRELREYSETGLSKEERRLYKEYLTAPEIGNRRLALFADCMSHIYPLPTALSSEEKKPAYERLFRLAAFAPIDSLPALKEILQQEASRPELLEIQQQVLEEVQHVPNIWKKENVSRSVVDFETILLEKSFTYDILRRVSFLCAHLDSFDKHTCKLFVKLLNKAETEPMRTQIYNSVWNRDHSWFEHLYTWSLLHNQEFKAVESLWAYIDGRHLDKAEMIRHSGGLIRTEEDAKKVQEYYTQWYDKQIRTAFNEQKDDPAFLKLLSQEYRHIQELDPDDLLQLRVVTEQILHSVTDTYLDRYHLEDMVELSSSEIALMSDILDYYKPEDRGVKEKADAARRQAEQILIIRDLDQIDVEMLRFDDRNIAENDIRIASETGPALNELCGRILSDHERKALELRLQWYGSRSRKQRETVKRAWIYEMFRQLLIDPNSDFLYQMRGKDMAWYLHAARITEQRLVYMMVLTLKIVDQPDSIFREHVQEITVNELILQIDEKQERIKNNETQKLYDSLEYLDKEQRDRLGLFGLKASGKI